MQITPQTRIVVFQRMVVLVEKLLGLKVKIGFIQGCPGHLAAVMSEISKDNATLIDSGDCNK